MSRRNKELEPLTGAASIDTLAAWAYDTNDIEEDGIVESSIMQPSTEQIPSSVQPEIIIEMKKHSLLKTLGRSAVFAGSTAIVLGVVGTVGYVANASNAFNFHDKQVAEIQPGKGDVLAIDTNFGPIRIGGFTTKATDEVTLGREFTGPFGFKIDYAGNTIVRQDTLQTNVKIDTDKLEIAYNEMDPTTPEDDVLTITLKKGAFGTETRIAPSVPGKNGLLINSAATIDSRSDISAIPFAAQKSMSDALAEKMGTYATKLPVFGDAAKKTISLQNNIEAVADTYLMYEVDNKCTEKVANLEDFTGQIKNNLRIAIRTVLLDQSTYENTTDPNLKKLQDLSSKQLAKLASRAVINLPDDYASQIVPDKSVSAAFKSFKNDSKLTTKIIGNKDGETGFTCGISKAAKMSLVDKNGSIIDDENMSKATTADKADK